jgi:hypothetical protein
MVPVLSQVNPIHILKFDLVINIQSTPSSRFPSSVPSKMHPFLNTHMRATYSTHSIRVDLVIRYHWLLKAFGPYVLILMNVRVVTIVAMVMLLRDFGLCGIIFMTCINYFSVSRPALGPTQPPVQWVPGVLSPGVKRGRGVTLSTHPHLVPRS